MKKLSLRIRKNLRNCLKACTLTSMLFVFQACYGVAPDSESVLELRLSGSVMSKSAKLPIQGIKVAVKDGSNHNYAITKADGSFSFYASISLHGSALRSDSIPLTFSDIDGDANGSFQNKEVAVNPQWQKEVVVFVELEELK